MSEQSGLPTTPAPGGAARVIMGLSLQPPLQRNETILVRWILALPLFVAAIGIYLAALVWVIGAWFSALAEGRVPDGLQRKLCGVLLFQARLSAYLYLLTDKWPGVHFDARPDDPVTIEVDHADLRRSAVFFRIILAIPAGVLASVVGSGIGLFLFVMWVVGIFRGRIPTALHQLAALTVRFTIRAAAYGLLVTPTQPFLGFFGDGAADAAAAPTLREPASRTPPLTAGPWLVERRVKTLMVIVIILGVLGGGANNHRASGFHWDIGAPRGHHVVAAPTYSGVTAPLLVTAAPAFAPFASPVLATPASRSRSTRPRHPL